MIRPRLRVRGKGGENHSRTLARFCTLNSGGKVTQVFTRTVAKDVAKGMGKSAQFSMQLGYDYIEE